MADVVNPTAVRFSNEQIRTIADIYARFYYAAKAVCDTWDAQGIGSIIPNTADVIVDGSAQDGRVTITGAQVNGLVNNIKAAITDLEATSKLKLNVLLKIAVNPRG